ncbi:DNA-directed RNA polymerase sigma-70 factor [Dyadobacter beijingensis]|uniref:DNA-directed RNA polymerase sigma-70 factor n=1 Tax=Dyadobacter beijingensis TaxID=365489 RepID=A0ABQ2IHW7_9BACT|nr:RNA polymerase sigma-70 factor [Dyadobacter beijingensis]GGN07143.1 DNA-directed RNA polymerase sigma-70 factor [Dyadobacter beijingensis]
MAKKDVDIENVILLLSSKADETAYTTLFDLYKHKLYGYLLSLTGSGMLAEDIVQDVFIKIWTDRENLAEVRNFDSYLFRMSKNHAINHFRKMSQETLIISEIFKAEPSQNSTDDSIALQETERLLEAAIEKLPAQQKTVYKLSRHQGLSHEEIADMLKISVHTVRNHIVQAMAAIRTHLRSQADVYLLAALTISFGPCPHYLA